MSAIRKCERMGRALLVEWLLRQFPQARKALLCPALTQP